MIQEQIGADLMSNDIINQSNKSQKPSSEHENHHFFEDFTQNLIHINGSDIEASLICAKNAMNQWSFYLINIHGQQVKRLLGHEYQAEEIVILDSIIREEDRNHWYPKIIPILEQGSLSNEWDECFSVLKKSNIHIISPINKEIHQIRISLTLERNSFKFGELYSFKVSGSNLSTHIDIANKAGNYLTTLRGTLKIVEGLMGELLKGQPELMEHRSSLETLSKEKLVELITPFLAFKETRNEKIQDILDCIGDGLKLCDHNETDFLPENNIPELAKTNIDAAVYINDELKKFIPALSSYIFTAFRHQLNINYSCSTNLLIPYEQYRILKQALSKLTESIIPIKPILITLSIEENNTLKTASNKNILQAIHIQLEITTRSVQEKTYSGKSLFFGESESPIEATIKMASHLLASIGANLCHESNSLKQVFAIYLPLISPLINKTATMLGFKSEKPFRTTLTQSQHKLLVDFSKQPHKKIILFVDDRILPLKMISKKFYKLLDVDKITEFPTQKKEWEDLNTNLLTQEIEGWLVIMAANGTLAFEIIKLLKTIHTMITDHNMPGGDGFQLIKKVRAWEARHPIKMNIALNTSVESFDPEIMRELDATYIIKGNHEVLNTFLSAALNLDQEKPSQSVMSLT